MLNVSAPGGRVPLRSMVFWSSTQSSCHVMVQSLCSSTTAQNFSRTTLFAAWALEPHTPSHWLWVPSSCILSDFLSGLHCHCVSLSGLHWWRLHVKPPQPGSYGGEQPRECSCTSGNAFVPTRFQRELDTSSYSKWWENLNSGFCTQTTSS